MDPREPIQNAPDPAQNSKVFKWLDNIWYHYKWQIIIGIFVLFTVTVCVVQCAGRKDDDLQFAYAGEKVFDSRQTEAFTKALSEAVPKDFNGDGEKTVQLVRFSVFTKQETEGTLINPTEGKSDFSYFILNSGYRVWLVSANVYQTMAISKRAEPLANTFGEKLLLGAVDEYAVRFQETAFYQQNKAVIGDLFSETDEVYLLLGARKVGEENQFERSRALFIAMVGKETTE